MGGDLLVCGTCIKSREKNSMQACHISTMEELLNLVIESDKIVTF